MASCFVTWQHKFQTRNIGWEMASTYVELLVSQPPFPQIDIIGAVVIVWRVKGGNYQVCSVQYCVQQLCTVRCTHI